MGEEISWTKTSQDILVELIQGSDFISRIARKIGVEPSTAIRNIRKLLNFGFVREKENSYPQNYFELTEKGRKTANSIKRMRESIDIDYTEVIYLD